MANYSSNYSQPMVTYGAGVGGLFLSCQVLDYEQKQGPPMVELYLYAEPVLDQSQLGTITGDGNPLHYTIQSIEFTITKTSNDNSQEITFYDIFPYAGGVNVTLVNNGNGYSSGMFATDALNVITTAMGLIGLIPGCEWAEAIGAISTVIGTAQCVAGLLMPASNTSAPYSNPCAGYDTPSAYINFSVPNDLYEGVQYNRACAFCDVDWGVPTSNTPVSIEVAATAKFTCWEYTDMDIYEPWQTFSSLNEYISTNVNLTVLPQITMIQPSADYTEVTGAATGSSITCPVELFVTKDAVNPSAWGGSATVQVSSDGGSTWETAAWQGNTADNSSSIWTYRFALPQPEYSATYTIEAKLTYTPPHGNTVVYCSQTVTVTLVHHYGKIIQPN
jgi:hypothetical protein